MNVNNIVSYQPQFKSAKNEQCPTCKRSNNDSILDKFETNVKNSADMNDTIQVPRSIFKGYLSFCAGSALMPVAGMIKNKMPRVSGALSLLNAGLIVYGTYSFVRPYIIRQEKNSEKSNMEQNIQPKEISEQKAE